MKEHKGILSSDRATLCFNSLKVTKLHFKRAGMGPQGGSVIKHPTSAQVMISRFIGSSPVSGCLLLAQNPLLILCLPLSLPLRCSHALSLSQNYFKKGWVLLFMNYASIKLTFKKMKVLGCLGGSVG